MTGIVVANPFHATDGTHAAVEAPDELRQLENSGYLICRLVHYHPLDFEPVTYRMRSLEHARSTDSLVCVALVDWDRVGESASAANRIDDGVADTPSSDRILAPPRRARKMPSAPAPLSPAISETMSHARSLTNPALRGTPIVTDIDLIAEPASQRLPR